MHYSHRADAARQFYTVRYKPAFDIHETIVDPMDVADAVFNNDDLTRPVLKVRDGSRLLRLAKDGRKRPVAQAMRRHRWRALSKAENRFL